MPDKLLKGSIDFDSAIKDLETMNEKIDEAEEKLKEQPSGFIDNEGKRTAKWKEDMARLYKELGDLKKKVLDNLKLRSLYDAMTELDDLVDEAIKFIWENFKFEMDSDKEKAAREGLVDLLKKIKKLKDSVEKRLPDMPDKYPNWWYLINRYLDPYLTDRIIEGNQENYELYELVKRIHEYKSYGIRELPSEICEEKMDWWYEKFKKINDILARLIESLDSYDFPFWLFPDYDGRLRWLDSMRSYKEEIEIKLKKYRQYYE